MALDWREEFVVLDPGTSVTMPDRRGLFFWNGQLAPTADTEAFVRLQVTDIPGSTRTWDRKVTKDAGLAADWEQLVFALGPGWTFEFRQQNIGDEPIINPVVQTVMDFDPVQGHIHSGENSREIPGVSVAIPGPREVVTRESQGDIDQRRLREAGVVESGFKSRAQAERRADALLDDRLPVDEKIRFTKEFDQEPAIGDVLEFPDLAGQRFEITELKDLEGRRWEVTAGSIQTEPAEQAKRERNQLQRLQRYG